MKRLISLLVAVCMLAMAVPALAEDAEGTPASGDATEAQERKDDGVDMGALLGVVGKLLGGSEDGSGEGGGIGEVLSMIGAFMNGATDENGEPMTVGGLLGKIKALDAGEGVQKPAVNTVPAENIEQFYGTWTLNKGSYRGLELPVGLLAIMGVKLAVNVNITEEGVSMALTYGEGTHEGNITGVTLELVDGALAATVDEETITLNLTEAGGLVCDMGAVVVYFDPAA